GRLRRRRRPLLPPAGRHLPDRVRQHPERCQSYPLRLARLQRRLGRRPARRTLSQIASPSAHGRRALARLPRELSRVWCGSSRQVATTSAASAFTRHSPAVSRTFARAASQEHARAATSAGTGTGAMAFHLPIGWPVGILFLGTSENNRQSRNGSTARGEHGEKRGTEERIPQG